MGAPMNDHIRWIAVALIIVGAVAMTFSLTPALTGSAVSDSNLSSALGELEKYMGGSPVVEEDSYVEPVFEAQDTEPEAIANYKVSAGWFASGTTLPSPSSGDWTQVSEETLGNTFSDDGTFWETKNTSGHNQYDYQMYEFDADVYNISLTWKGYGENVDGYDVYLYVWNVSDSSWDQVDTDFLGAEGTLSFTSSTATDYKNGIKIYFAAAAKHYNYAPVVSDAGRSPADDATVASPTLSWDAWSDQDGDTVEYYVETFDGAACSGEVLSNSGWTTSTSWEPTKYGAAWNYWHIKARSQDYSDVTDWNSCYQWCNSLGGCDVVDGMGMPLIEDDNMTLATNTSNSSEFQRSLNTDYVVLNSEKEASSTSCGTLKESVTLTSGVSSDDTCFTFAADDIVLDCGGNTVQFGSGYSGFLLDGYTNITIQNCQVNGQDAGYSVDASGAASAVLKNFTFYGGKWFKTVSSSLLEFENVTFETVYGSINYDTLSTATYDDLIIDQSDITIAQYTAIVDSASNALLNKSASIALQDSAAMADRVAYSTAGGYELCPSSVCQNISYDGSSLSFDVTHFTNYTSTRNISACAELQTEGRLYYLTANVSSASSCFDVLAGTVGLFCQGNSITFNTGGTDGKIGVDINNNTEVTVRDCIILAGNSTSGSGTVGVYMSGATDAVVYNNTIRINGTGGGLGVRILSSSSDANVSDNIIYTDGSGSNNDAISIDSSSGAHIANNLLSTDGTGNSDGVQASVVSDATVINNEISTAGSGTGNRGVSFSSDAAANDNLTIRNNNISTDGTSSNYGIYMLWVTNSSISSNNITTTGSVPATGQDHGIYVHTDSDNNNLTDNVIVSDTSNTRGIYFVGSTDNYAENNDIHLSGQDVHGLSVFSASNEFVNNYINASGVGSAGVDSRSGFLTFNHTFIDDSVTWINSTLAQFITFDNTVFNTEFGNMNLSEFGPDDVVDRSNLDVGDEWAFINTSEHSWLNVSGIITFEDVTYDFEPIMTVDFDDDGTFETCPSSVCEKISFAGDVFVFNVTHFTNYSLNGSPRISQVILNATSVNNYSSDNLTAHFINVTNATKNITDWRLDGDSIAVLNMPFEATGSESTVAKDYSIFDNNGNVTNAVFNATGGHDGFGVYEFNGDDAYITIGDDPSLDVQQYEDFSLTAWINVKGDTAVADTSMPIVSKGIGATYTYLLSASETNVVMFSLYNGAINPSVTGGTISRNTWYHVAATYNGSIIKLYYNGVLNNTQATTITMGDYNTDTLIGAWPGAINARGKFNGTIDDVQVWNRSLSQEQITALYNNRSDLIVSEETAKDDVWQVCATPNDGNVDGSTVCSNNLTILSEPPVADSVILNATSPLNLTEDNLTAHFNVSDPDGDAVKNITDWRVENISIALLIMPFEGGSSVLDAGAAGATRDYSMNEKNGTVYVRTWDDEIGHDSFGAYSFDVTDSEYINVGSNVYDDVDLGSIDAWINMSSVPPFGDNYTIFGVSSSSAGKTGDWFFGVFTDGDGNTRLRVGYNSAGIPVTIAGSTPLSANTYYHVAVTSNGTAYKLYVDGDAETLEVIDGSNDGEWWDKIATIIRTTYYDIGRLDNRNGVDKCYFNGMIDDLNLWNRTISPEMVVMLNNSRTDIMVSQETVLGDNWSVCMTPNDRSDDGNTVCSNELEVKTQQPSISQVILNSTTGENISSDNLTAYFINVSDPQGDDVKNITNWRLDGTSVAVLNMPFEATGSQSSVAKDYSDSGFDGNVTNAVFNATGGHDGRGAYGFNGVDAYIDVGDNKFSSNTGMITAWIYVDAYSGGEDPIFQQGQVNSDTNGMRFLLRDTVNISLVHDKRACGGSLDAIQTATPVSTGAWHFIALGSDGSDYIIYLDGSPVSYSTWLGSPDGDWFADLCAGTLSDFIGRWKRSSNDEYFNGTIDEFMIWDRPLSQEQITALYNNRTDLIVSEETSVDDTWQVCATPNDGNVDGATVCSNSLTIINYRPSMSQVILNTSSGENTTDDNLTAHFINVTDLDGQAVKNITDWRLNGTSIVVLNMPFEGGSTSGAAGQNGTTRDYSSANYSVEITDGADWSASGGVDGFGAYYFDDAVGGALYVPGINWTFSEFSVAWWLYPVSLRDWNQGLGAQDWGAFLWHSSANGGVYAGTDVVTRFDPVDLPAGTVELNKWQHFTFVYNGSDGFMYKNGSLLASKAMTAPIAWTTFQLYSINGTADEVYVFNRTLTQQQIQALYDLRTDIIVSQETSVGENWSVCATPNDMVEDGDTVCSNDFIVLAQTPSIDQVILNSSTGQNVTTDDLLAYFINVTDPQGDSVFNITDWRLNANSTAFINMPFEATGTETTIAKDYSVFGNNGTITNAVFDATGGHDGRGAYEFSGNGYITVPYNDSMNVSSEVSVAVWYKSSLRSGNKFILEKEGDNNYGDYSIYGGATANYVFTVNNYDEGVSCAADNDGKWHFLVGTYDGSELRCYTDGVSSAPVSYSTPIDTHNDVFRIGTFSGWYFNGTIDNVQVFDRTLSSEQITEMYNNRTDLIVSEETSKDDVWKVCATPNDGNVDGATVCSNNLTILNSPPSITEAILNATSTANLTSDNLTAHFINVSDLDGDAVKNITDWRISGSSIAVLNTPFEGGSTTDFTKDYSVFQNNLANVNGDGPTWNSTGGFDGWGAYYYDGADYFEADDSPSLSPTDTLSITAWVKIDDVTRQDPIVCKPHNWTNGDRSYLLRLNPDDVEFYIAQSDDTQVGGSFAGLTVDTGWHFISAVANGTHLRAYLDGQVSATTYAYDDIHDSSGKLWVGQYNANFMQGKIDELKIFNHSLTAEQITAMYNNRSDLIVSQETQVGENWSVCATPNDREEDGSEVCSNDLIVLAQEPSIDQVILNTSSNLNRTSDDLLAYFINVTDPQGHSVFNITDWRLDTKSIAVLNMPFEATGVQDSIVKDYSIFGNNGTPGGAVFNATGGYDGRGAYEFSGDANGIDLPVLGSDGNDAFTVTAWIKPRGPDFGAIYFQGDLAGNSQRHYGVRNTNAMYFAFYGNDLNSNTTVTDDAWNHVAFAFNGSVGTHYIDGRPAGTKNFGSVTVANNDYSIGYRRQGADFKFNGTIDEFRLFNRSLSPEQITEMYNNRTDVIVSEETAKDDVWQVCATPNDGNVDGSAVCSNNLTVLSTPPSMTQVILNATSIYNTTVDNLTAHFINVSDVDGDAVKNITDWRVNSTSIALINLPFEGGSTSWDGITVGSTRDYSSYNVSVTVPTAVAWASDSGHDGFGAYTFDADNGERIYLGYGLYDDVSSGSVDAWINLSSGPDTGENFTIYGVSSTSGGNPAGGDWAFQVYLTNDGDPKLQVVRYNYSNGGLAEESVVVSGSTALNVGQYYHVAVTSNGSEYKMYVDGEEETLSVITGSNDGSWWDYTNAATAWYELGRLNTQLQYFNGTIDDFHLWNRTLSPEMIGVLNDSRPDLIVSNETAVGDIWQVCATPNDRSDDGSTVCSNNVTINKNQPTITSLILNATTIYNTTYDDLTAHISSFDPVAGRIKNITDWHVENTSICLLNAPIDGGTTTTWAKDYSMYGNNLSDFTGSAATFNSTDGHDGFGSLEFDGSSEVFTTPNDVFNSSASGAIEAWIRPDKIYSNGAGGTFLGTASNTALQGLGGFQVYGVSGTNRIRVGGNCAAGLSDIDYVYGNTTIPTSSWTHVVVQSNGSAWEIFVNGNRESLTLDTGTNTGAWFSDWTSCGGSMRNSVGALIRSTGIIAYYNGSVDTIRVFNTTLSEAQINNLYNDRLDLIDSDDTQVGQNWSVCATPNNGLTDGDQVCSNTVEILDTIDTLNVTESINGTISPNAAQFLTFNTENNCTGVVTSCTVAGYDPVEITNNGSSPADIKVQIPTTTPFNAGSNWQIKITNGTAACNLYQTYTTLSTTGETLVYKSLGVNETITLYYQFDMYSNVSVAKQDTKNVTVITSRPGSTC